MSGRILLTTDLYLKRSYLHLSVCQLACNSTHLLLSTALHASRHYNRRARVLISAVND